VYQSKYPDNQSGAPLGAFNRIVNGGTLFRTVLVLCRKRETFCGRHYRLNTGSAELFNSIAKIELTV